MNEEFKKRLLSFIWRLGAYVVATTLTFLVVNLADLQLPQWLNLMIGLAAGEITKWLNKTYQLGSKALGAFKK